MTPRARLLFRAVGLAWLAVNVVVLGIAFADWLGVGATYQFRVAHPTPSELSLEYLRARQAGRPLPPTPATEPPVLMWGGAGGAVALLAANVAWTALALVVGWGPRGRARAGAA